MDENPDKVPLDEEHRQKCVQIAEQLGLSDAELAEVLRLPPAALAQLREIAAAMASNPELRQTLEDLRN
jgi:hypothetical protein